MRLVFSPCAVLMFGLLSAGCGGGAKTAANAEKLLKDQIAALDEVSAAFEKVRDKASYAATEPEIQALMAKVADLDKQLSGLGAELKEAAIKDNKAQFDAAMARLKRAKEKAATFR